MLRSRISILKSSLALAMAAGVSAAACAQLAGIDEREFDGSQAMVVSELCVEYCDTVLEACPTNYTTQQTCQGVCMLLEEGEQNEPLAIPNSVACRLNNARQAANVGGSEREDFCKNASPGGNGVCGTNCQSYCHLVERACDDYNAKVPNCVQKCEAFGDSRRFNVGGTEEFDHSGATVQCRLVHVSTATVSSADAETHCPHADFHPSNWCYDPVPSCEQYCRVVGVACKDENAQYDNDDQCMAACAELDLGAVQDEVEDTIGCRTYHGISSLADPKTHCPHAGPTGDGHCGKDVAPNNPEGKAPQFAACRPYCRLLEAACQTDFDATWDSPEACISECDQSDASFQAALDQLYTVDTAQASGDTLLCRTLHAVRAFEDADQCAAAFGAAPCN